jgi:uncharacterized protein involved in exopolysaccharide biosynthesis
MRLLARIILFYTFMKKINYEATARVTVDIGRVSLRCMASYGLQG